MSVFWLLSVQMRVYVLLLGIYQLFGYVWLIHLKQVFTFEQLKIKHHSCNVWSFWLRFLKTEITQTHGALYCSWVHIGSGAGQPIITLPKYLKYFWTPKRFKGALVLLMSLFLRRTLQSNSHLSLCLLSLFYSYISNYSLTFKLFQMVAVLHMSVLGLFKNNFDTGTCLSTLVPPICGTILHSFWAFKTVRVPPWLFSCTNDTRTNVFPASAQKSQNTS